MSFLHHRKILATATLTAGKALAGQVISFSHRPTGTTQWHFDGTAKTNLSGVAVYTITGLVRGTKYDVKAHFDGTMIYDTATAEKMGILV